MIQDPEQIIESIAAIVYETSFTREQTWQQLCEAAERAGSSSFSWMLRNRCMSVARRIHELEENAR